MKPTKKDLEAALKACVDLLEDIRQDFPRRDLEIRNLYNWHPLIKKVGGHYWYWDSEDECWKNKGH